MKIPLDDHAAMYVAATRTGLHRPCIGLLRHYDEPVTGDALLRWANELAQDPQGLGRRVVRPRVPGARLRWAPAADLPPIRFEPDELSVPELMALMEEEASQQIDPAATAGWRMAAARTADGGSMVSLWVNHAYGDARALLTHGFGGGSSTVPQQAPVRGWRADTVEELGDVVTRVRHGLGGTVRLGREVAVALARPSATGDLQRLSPTIAAVRSRNQGVGARSGRRLMALTRVRAADWDGVAQARGGSGNTLLLSVLANLLRTARLSRGDTVDGPLRILLPVDLRHQRPQGQHDVTANAVVGALVVLPGGTPQHGSIADVRVATKRAIEAAAPVGASRRDGRPAGPTGVVDAMRLLPSALSNRLAVLAQGADGVASNVGPLPDLIGRLGRHQASAAYLMGGPMMTDLTIGLGRWGEDITLGVMADAGRLGPSGTLQTLVSAEIAAWGLTATVW
ncbi:hypothetical protein GB931_03985 [Modestobacter sp. I12A-02628]|uniref:Diacylglycerol O-acyltransferase n=1 Tax=Goekera deserti TaxID=2497753 RepID=A0A7K3WKV9_9ACTN|nr:hypothetical protein [Goekera deserti]MPQ97099.1 hypothetical protein [Goekera deserti]NDI46584.1 hypothetical protein [Goekera deserti]NEL56340.1 hypothetical protein [Goekera deserti]